MIKIKIGLDFDDVLAPFNSIACHMANEEYGLDLSIQNITSWKNTGKASVIKKYYHDARLYTQQTAAITEDAKKAVRELSEFADVYFITAVYPEFMSVRAAQILSAFPGTTPDRIILGSAKDLVQFDFLLDDNINNILTSPAKYPILFRKPWNSDMTGLLSVNSLEEFIFLVKTVSATKFAEDTIRVPSVIALVGPSGSGKNEVAEMLCSDNPLVARPIGFTTKPNDYKRIVLTEEEFEAKCFFEKTRYGGFGYGFEEQDIEILLACGRWPVIPIDICGALRMKFRYPTVTIYLKRDRSQLVHNIITDRELSDEEKTLRILSLEAEIKNESICDYAFEADETAEKINELIG